MLAIIADWSTEVYPTDAEVQRLCQPGQGAQTCVWLTMALDGWECCYFHRPAALVDRWMAGETTATRDGCAPLHAWSPVGQGCGVVEIPLQEEEA